WEHLALTRARTIAGDPRLCPRVDAAISDVLTTPRDPDRLLREVADMRQRLRNEFGTDNPWMVKHCRGGLVDLEFIWQYLVLRHGAESPEILSRNSAAAIERLQAHGC